MVWWYVHFLSYSAVGTSLRTEVFFFPGCIASYFDKSHIKSLINPLVSIDIRFVTNRVGGSGLNNTGLGIRCILCSLVGDKEGEKKRRGAVF